MQQQVPDTQGRTRTISLRLKLTIWMILISTALQLTLALIVMMYQRQSMSRLSTTRMASRAESAADAVRKANFRITDQELSQLTETYRFAAVERFIITLYADGGEVVASSKRPPPPASELGLARVSDNKKLLLSREFIPGLYDSGEEQFKGRLALQLLQDSDNREYVLLVAKTDSYFETVLGVTSKVLIYALIIGVVASAIGGWMIARLATAPLEDLRRIAGSLSPEGIDEEMHLVGSTREVGLLERELLDARSRLRAAMQAKDRFIASVSHELKTPIAVLLTEGQTLRQDGLTADGRKFVQSVTDEMRRLGRMVDSFLTLTKIHGGKELVQGQLQGVNDFVMDAVISGANMARQYHVSLSPELSESEPPLVVSGDADLLRVMVDNLINNAIRFSPEHQRVVIRVREIATECEIAVRDFGPGVPEEMLASVFDRFVQAPEVAGRSRGYGLGLSIAQGIAELHGGRITVSNAPPPDGGCEFLVRLPLTLDAVAVAEPG